MKRTHQRRMTRVSACLAAAALVTAACGGSSGTTPPDDSQPISAVPDSVSGQDPAGTTTNVATDDQGAQPPAASIEDVEQARAAARMLTESFAGDELAAFDAVAYALNNGYDGGQILDGINTASLGADGQITGVEPNLRAPDLLTSQGESIARRRVEEPTPSRLPIEDLRDSAYATGGQLDGYKVGNEGIVTILLLTFAGASLEEIIDFVVLGIPPRFPQFGCALEAAGCSELEPEPDATTPTDEVVETTPVTAADAGDTERFVGTLAEFLGDTEGAEILVDRTEFIVEDGTLSGTAELLANGDFVGDPACLYARFELTEIPSTGPQSFAGPATAVAAFPDGNCPGGPPAEQASSEVSITATVSGDKITVNVTGWGDDLVTLIAAQET